MFQFVPEKEPQREAPAFLFYFAVFSPLQGKFGIDDLPDQVRSGGYTSCDFVPPFVFIFKIHEITETFLNVFQVRDKSVENKSAARVQMLIHVVQRFQLVFFFKDVRHDAERGDHQVETEIKMKIRNALPADAKMFFRGNFFVKFIQHGLAGVNAVNVGAFCQRRFEKPSCAHTRFQYFPLCVEYLFQIKILICRVTHCKINDVVKPGKMSGVVVICFHNKRDK